MKQRLRALASLYHTALEDQEEARRLRFIAWAKAFRDEQDGEIILKTGELVTRNQVDTEQDKEFWRGK